MKDSEIDAIKDNATRESFIFRFILFGWWMILFTVYITIDTWCSYNSTAVNLRNIVTKATPAFAGYGLVLQVAYIVELLYGVFGKRRRETTSP